MRRYTLAWLRASIGLSVVVSIMLAGPAWGEVIMVVQSTNLNSAPDVAVDGFLDVYFQVTGSNPGVAGYQLRLDLTPARSGVTLGKPVATDGSAPIRPALFPTAPTDLGSTASRIQVTDFLASGDKQINDGDGLVRVPFEVAPNTSGDFWLNINMGDTLLSDAGGNPIPFGALHGLISVTAVPEPASWALLLGLLAAIGSAAIHHRCRGAGRT